MNLKRKKIYFAVFSAISFGIFSLAANSVMAAPNAPVNVTIAETDADAGNACSGWWPSDFSAATPWIEAFRAAGVDIIAPYALADPPRLSPTVYGQCPLSRATAKTMASLFGAPIIVNGSVSFACSPNESQVVCAASSQIEVADASAASAAGSSVFRARAETAAEAKNQLRRRIAFETVPQLIIAQNARSRALPAIVQNPVLRIAALPDADAIVALRKCLKQTAGVADVAERFVANGMLALEINPANPPEYNEFAQIVHRLIAGGCGDYQIQESDASAQGITIEITKF